LPVIITSYLDDAQEEKLLDVLREHKEAIGWTIDDIKGISPSVVMHKIHLEEDAKPLREPQRRLNPAMQEVVRAKVIKLLDADIVYPISNSKWVSLIHVVPKWAGLTVVENKDGELVPTRVQSGWRVCIDYQKLNAATRKDHFSLSFIDQMVERLAGHEYLRRPCGRLLIIRSDCHRLWKIWLKTENLALWEVLVFFIGYILDKQKHFM
jgi:hypothetical protein